MAAPLALSMFQRLEYLTGHYRRLLRFLLRVLATLDRRLRPTAHPDITISLYDHL